MKKIIFLTLLQVYLITGAQAQYKEPEYINYGSVFNAVSDFVKAADTVLWKQSIDSLLASVQSVKEEGVISLRIAGIKGGKKELSDEEIYRKRKTGVLTIGRLRRVSGTNINLDVLGTAFIISKEGHCVTNAHVLQELFGMKTESNDLLYFVIAEDKQIHVIDRLYTYSNNNDFAVFRISGEGRTFDPIPLGKPLQVGEPVYCISHPAGELYYFSKGMVARNISRDGMSLGTTYSATGRTPIRMEISADYGGGSSGGPILDKYGNLAGIVASTNTIYLNEMQNDGAIKLHPQMVIRSAIPVKALTDLLGK